MRKTDTISNKRGSFGTSIYASFKRIVGGRPREAEKEEKINEIFAFPYE